jgi:DNA-directed RNA polymerase subunit K/omega
MSVRSYLLFAAQKKIPNPFLLCTVTSARSRQLMVTCGGRTALAELVNFALNEVAAGALEFERVGPGRSSAALPAEAT